MNAVFLNLISTDFFFFGHIASKLKTIPLAFISTLLHFVSLSAFLIGYAIWGICGVFYPNYPRKKEQWYGFAEYKQQFQLAALLGAVATTLCIIAPSLIITSAWIYTLSNIFWTISEYHKKENPPAQDLEFSSTKQNLYFKFSALVTSGTLVATLSASIIAIVPATTLVLSSFAMFTSTGLTVSALYFLGKTLLGNYQPDNIIHSYTKLTSGLEIPNNEQQKNTCDLITNPSNKQTQYPFFQLSDVNDIHIERRDCELNFNFK